MFAVRRRTHITKRVSPPQLFVIDTQKTRERERDDFLLKGNIIAVIALLLRSQRSPYGEWPICKERDSRDLRGSRKKALIKCQVKI